ncbi:MAG: squalene synthase HpnC [Gemmatales bacterium]|nr:squalene synthase HpnC [Gemmatales bacterium]MDW8387214.1 squalene synthase HpnC [Gemmatales bacterium]
MSTTFAEHLRRYGPDQPLRPVSLPEARSYCRHLALTHYENFSVASLLLPRRLLRHFHHLYAFCRWADDLGDETDPAEARRLLGWWRQELLDCYDGTPRHPVLIALQETIRTFAIPPDPFLDLLSAFEQDQVVKEYETFEQLLDYCRRSANPVGRLILHVTGCYNPERAALSDAICTGLQLANFWQDVRRDWDIGRIYLPREDRERFRYADADLRQRRFTPAFRELMAFEVERARDFFERGRPLIERMPREMQIEIELFIRGGEAILDRIVAQGYDVWKRRPTLSRVEKAALIVRAVLGRWLRRAGWPSLTLRVSRRAEGVSPPVNRAEGVSEQMWRAEGVSPPVHEATA